MCFDLAIRMITVATLASEIDVLTRQWMHENEQDFGSQRHALVICLKCKIGVMHYSVLNQPSVTVVTKNLKNFELINNELYYRTSGGVLT